jgi:predicted RND superfamily exporter protein
VIPRGLLERLLLFAGRRHVAVGVVVFALVVVALLLTARLRLDADVLNLLPKHNPQVQAYRDTLEQFGSIDYFVVGIRIPEGAPFDPYAAYSDELVARMSFPMRSSSCRRKGARRWPPGSPTRRSSSG